MKILRMRLKEWLPTAALWIRGMKMGAVAARAEGLLPCVQNGEGVGIRPVVQLRMPTGSAIRVLVGTIVCLLTSEATAQNPSFGGREFRRVWVGGTIPDGASETPSLGDLYLTSAGVYIQSYLTPLGIFFLDDEGAVTVAAKNQAQFSAVTSFGVVGWNPDGSLIFGSGNWDTNYPCQLYNGGLTELSSPTSAQTLNLGNYFDGRMAYMTVSGSSGTKIWYYTEGNDPELWLEDDDMPGLATMLDYDGETLAFSVSLSEGGYELWRRASDGTLTRIIKYGDLMPGETNSVFVSTPAVDTVEVDQGTVYMLGSGYGPNTQILFSSSDGVTFDVIANRWEDVPGLPGITINGMKLLQVSNGRVWLWVKQSDGDEVLYQIVEGTWTRVVGKSDSFDGRTAYNLEAYEHGSLGDSVVIALALPSSEPPYFAEELYTNADLPGFSAGSAGPLIEIIPQLDGGFFIATMGEAGTTNTLQTISSLTNTVWETVGEPKVADGTNMMEWTVSPTNSAGFFRLVE